MAIPPLQIEPQHLASLTPKQKWEVADALYTINNPVLLPAGGPEYKEAWQKLVRLLPKNVAQPLIARALVQLPKNSPYREAPLSLFVGAQVCFSSRRFSYERQAQPFNTVPFQTVEEMGVGSEYVPMIEASLDAGVCSPQEVMTILHDLLYIGSPGMDEGREESILDKIARNHWQDSPEFARAFLKLAYKCFFRESYADPFRKAMARLIPADGGSPSPSDEKLVRKALNKAMLDLPADKSDQFYRDLAADRPAFKSKLENWTDILRRLNEARRRLPRKQ